MLISYPVLGAAQIKESPSGGRYPLTIFSDDKHEGLIAGWHGGTHLEVPAGTGGSGQVRAIAEGDVVAFRMPTGKPASPIPDTENPDPSTAEGAKKLRQKALAYNGWTDDGFILLRHEKECGKDRPVVFYSLYMHLSVILQPDLKKLKAKPGELLSAPKKKGRSRAVEETIVVKRKETLGFPGTIENQANQIHFEIFTSDNDFNKFFPGEPSVTDPCLKGSMDPWGELYFLVGAGRPVIQQKPIGKALPNTTLSVPTDLRIALSYRDGRACYRSLDVNGYELEYWEDKDLEVEYQFYASAKKYDSEKMSRSYELTSFARFMDWPELANDNKPSPARCWHWVPMVGGWVDFADPAVKKLSAADFPKWCWEKVGKGKSGLDPSNGLWDVSKLLQTLDENGEGSIAELEFKDWFKQDVNKALLRQMAVQFQSEWDSSEPDKRWGWVKLKWTDPAKHESEALKRKQIWVNEQKGKADLGKRELPKRIKRMNDWITQLVDLKTNASNDLAAAEQKKAQAQQAKDDFNNNVGNQKTNLLPKTPPAEHNKAVNKKQDLLSKAITAASNEKKKAEKWAGNVDSMILRANACKSREEAKLHAAENMAQKALTEIDQLDSAILDSKKKKAASNAASIADNKFEDFKKHMKALQFWEEVKQKVNAQAGISEERKFPESTVWHFHPLAFIEYFKKCHWLSENDLKAIYPSTPLETRETYRVALNRVMWKYGITSAARIAHFYGQAKVECAGLHRMMEISQSPNMSAASKASEEGGYYKDPRDWYFTHYQHYQRNRFLANKEQANLVKANGTPFTEWDEINDEFDENLQDAATEKNDAEKALRALRAKRYTAVNSLKNLKNELVVARASNNRNRIDQASAAVDAKNAEIAQLDEDRQAQESALAETVQKAKNNSLKERMKRFDQAASNIDLINSTTGDAIKFRGRGMKQLTGRYNYADYWYHRGWISSADHVAMKVADPQRVSTVPFNCIDSGGWYFNSRPSGPIIKFIREGDVSPNSIFNVSAAINGLNASGKPNELPQRQDATISIFGVVNDEPLP